MPVNGVRVLPDIPKNMPNMEVLIREFETGFCSLSINCRDTTSKSSTLSDGNFVKKIVEAYESSVRASNQNNQWERTKEKSGFFNTLDVIKNQRNVEKNGSSSVIYDVPYSRCRNNFKKKSKIFLTPFEARDVENDFVILNRYHTESDVKTVSETWSESFPKINMYSSMNELSMNVQSSPSKRNEIWNLKKKSKKLEDKTKKSKLVTCSSPLEDVKDGLDCEDPLDDILTSSCDSSSNNSYRNLQADLYGFEDKQWQLERSSTSSLSSLKSSLGSSHDNMLNINNDHGSLKQDSSFQDVTVTSFKDITVPEDREDHRNTELVPNPSSNFDRKSPQTISASLNKDLPIKIDNNTCVTWVSALGEKLSQKKPLKKLLKSAFNIKILNKKSWKKSAEEQLNERTSDSGFIERFLSSSFSSSQKSWQNSDSNDKPSSTFRTFGRAKNTCDKTWSKNSRMILTEDFREELTSDSKPSNSTPWVPLRATSSCKENHRNVESSLKGMMFTSSSKLKASCKYPPLPKHPYPIRNRISKHPFVAKTKLDQTTEKSVEEKEMKCNAKEYDTPKLESSGTSPVSQAKLNISYSKMSEWLTSSPNNNCDLLR